MMLTWLRRMFSVRRKKGRVDQQAPAPKVSLSIPPNAERVPLSMVDEGKMFLQMRAMDPKMTDADLATRIGKSPSYVSRAIHAALTTPIPH